jgi:hypothetical protein
VGSRPCARTRRCDHQSWRRCRPWTKAAWWSGNWEATPTAGSRSLAPHRTASNAPAKVPGSRDPEVRLPAGKVRRRCRCQSPGTRTIRRGRNSGGSSVATAPWSGAGAQAPEDGGGGGVERSSTTSAPTPAAGEEIGGGAPASSEAADSSSTTTDTASGDATTTIRAETIDPTTATRSTGGRGHPPKVRGVLGREEGPPSGPGQMGVVRLCVSSFLRVFLYSSQLLGPNHVGDTAGPKPLTLQAHPPGPHRLGELAPSQRRSPRRRHLQGPCQSQRQKPPDPRVRSRRSPRRHDPKPYPRRRPPDQLRQPRHHRQHLAPRLGLPQLSQQLRGPLQRQRQQRRRLRRLPAPPLHLWKRKSRRWCWEGASFRAQRRFPSPDSYPNASKLSRSWRLACAGSGRSWRQSATGSPTGRSAWATA